MSSKRELEPSGTSSSSPPPSPKRRKTQDAGETAESLPYNPKNLLKSGAIPSGQAYQQAALSLDLCLSPVDAIDALGGVERQLDDVLLSYIKEAGGILMGWNAPRFRHPIARVLEESPFTYAQIEVDTVIWRPRRGEQLEGQVKLMGPSHIGILILGTFNASVPLPLIPPDWTYEENFEGDDGFWRDGSGTALEMDQTLRFKTVNIKKGANMLSVEGSLLELSPGPKDEDKETRRGKQDQQQEGEVGLSKVERKARRKSGKAAAAAAALSKERESGA